MSEWYEIDNIEAIDSPSLVLYEDNLMYNLQNMVSMVGGDTTMLMPHLKTNKMPKVIHRMMALGIKNFKASTIAEAEIAAREGAHSVLIAHQLVGPKVNRFLALCTHFPNTSFSTLVDNVGSAKILNDLAIDAKIVVDVYIDINSGMNRSGIALGPGLKTLLETISNCKGLELSGLHVYDGHLRHSDFQNRKHQIEEAFEPINNLFERLKPTCSDIKLICGGTPSFTTHKGQKNRITSPGTCVLWDWGYGEKLKEQDFKPAALLVCRVISKPTKGIITIDLGHKAVGSENPIDKRVKFLNLEHYELISQSEEHGVLSVSNWDTIAVGDVYYGIPYHICPTVNLYDEVSLIRNHKKIDTWEVTARQRKVTI
jgi:3-hydroxy-D-aspartate aldolase